MFRISKTSLLLVLAALASHAVASPPPDCQAPPKLGAQFVDEYIAQSTIAFQAEVIAADPDQESPQIAARKPPAIEGFDQKVAFRILHAWKGPHHAGEIVSRALRVINLCGGYGCVFPFKTGDVTLILSSSSPSNCPEGFGCWLQDGVENQEHPVGSDSINPQLIGFLIVLAIFAALLGGIMYLVKGEQRTIDSAQKLIANPEHLQSGQVTFRKHRLAGYLLSLVSLLVLFAVLTSLIYSSGSFHFAVRPLGFSTGLVILILLVPIIMTVKEFRYTICVTDDELVISDFTTKRITLRDISDVKVGAWKASSFCQIRLITGEEDLRVASDLKNFPEFVSLLCDRVSQSKSRGDGAQH
jgi:hypothetical protein